MGKKESYKKPFHEYKDFTNMKQMTKYSCKTYAQKTAFLIKNKSTDEYMPISYTQFGKDINSLGTALIDFGFKGKRVAIIGENRYEWAVSYLAVVNGVGIVVPLDKELPENEMLNLIERSKADAIIFSGKFDAVMISIAEKLSNELVYICMDDKRISEKSLVFADVLEKGAKLVKGGDKRFIDAKIEDDVMSIMLFTSGTTVTSKAVMLSHRNIATNVSDMGKMIHYDANDVLLSVLPLNHTYECSCGFLAPISHGCAIAYCEGLRHIAKNLKESQATIMLSVPLILESVHKRIWEKAAKKPGGVAVKLKIAIFFSNILKSLFKIDLTKKLFNEIHETFGGRLRQIICGAAKLDPRVAKGFRDLGIHFIQGYGLTECSPIVAMNMDTYFKDNSIGLPMPSMQVKIEKAQPYHKIGEIVVKGPNVMLGYYENEEATAQAIKDGWFYTGDMGYMDRKGFLYITGRKKDLIVTKNGKNIFPEELEILINRIPIVKESMIFGKPNSDGDTLICAAIVLDKEYIEMKFQDKATDEMIKTLMDKEIKAINKKIPNYKHIKEYKTREDEFKKTTTQKIKRYMEMVNNLINFNQNH